MICQTKGIQNNFFSFQFLLSHPLSVIEDYLKPFAGRRQPLINKELIYFNSIHITFSISLYRKVLYFKTKASSAFLKYVKCC